MKGICEEKKKKDRCDCKTSLKTKEASERDLR